MKHISKLAMFVAAALLSASSAFAQDVAKADIPFDFICQQKAMPHGTYIISSLNDRAIEVLSKNGKAHAISIVESTDTVRGTGKKLVFHRYGDQYFLTEVQAGTGDVDLQLPVSKSEKQVRLNEAKLGQPETTFVAMK